MAKKSPHRPNKLFKYLGGFLKSDVFYYDEDDTEEKIFVSVWGHVIHNPAIHVYNMKKTEFAIRYMRGGYIIVNIWGDTPAAEVAATLKPLDMVCVRGIVTRHKYTNKYGENKEIRTLSAFSVEPYDYTVFMSKLYRSPSIRKMLEQDETDAFESLKDYMPQEEETTETDDLPFV